MGLFLDTTNKKFIIALIQNGVVSVFEMKDTNSRVAKYANQWIKEFLIKQKIKIIDINEYYITKGPGSFTGIKVALNIIKSFALVDDIKYIYTIDTLDLIRDKSKSNAALSFGKEKYYLRKYNSWYFKGIPMQWHINALTKGFKIVKELPVEKTNKYTTKKHTEVDYDNFTKDKLENKLKKFKKEKIDKIELIYQKVKYK